MIQYNKGLFLYNGDAGPDQMNEKLSVALPVLSQHVEELRVVQTKSPEDLKEKCKEYGEEVEVIYILGGDGTVHDSVNALAQLENRPVIGVLPGGTCNDFTRMLGMPQNIKAAAQALVDGRVAPVDVGEIQNEGYFLNFWGIGLVTDTSLNIDPAQKDRFGVLSYFISAVKTMNASEPSHYKITIDQDDVYEEEGVMALVMNGQYIGTRYVPVPGLNVNDGKLDVLVVKNSNLSTFKELINMNQPGKDTDDLKGIFHRQASEVKIETENEQEVDTDGEIYLKTPGHIKVLPNHLRMIFHQTQQ